MHFDTEWRDSRVYRLQLIRKSAFSPQQSNGSLSMEYLLQVGFYDGQDDNGILC